MSFLLHQRLKVDRKMPAQWEKKDKRGERLLRKWFKMQERKEQLKVEKSKSKELGQCVGGAC